MPTTQAKAYASAWREPFSIICAPASDKRGIGGEQKAHRRPSFDEAPRVAETGLEQLWVTGREALAISLAL